MARRMAAVLVLLTALLVAACKAASPVVDDYPLLTLTMSQLQVCYFAPCTDMRTASVG